MPGVKKVAFAWNRFSASRILSTPLRGRILPWSGAWVYHTGLGVHAQPDEFWSSMTQIIAADRAAAGPNDPLFFISTPQYHRGLRHQSAISAPVAKPDVAPLLSIPFSSSSSI